MIERVISRAEFIGGLSDAELSGLISAGRNSPDVEVFLLRLKLGNGSLDLDSEHMQTGVAAMVSKGLINQARADEIRKL